MKHKVTLNESDIRQAINVFIESNFPGFSVGEFNLRHSKVTGPMEQDFTEIEVGLTRTPEGKD